MNRLSIAHMAGSAGVVYPGHRGRVGFENRKQANTDPTHPTHPTHIEGGGWGSNTVQLPPTVGSHARALGSAKGWMGWLA